MELQTIQSKIYDIRGCRVMLDFDLAQLYQVETSILKRAVRRNIERFPEDFMFELSDNEYNELKIRLRCQIGSLEKEDGRGKYPKFAPFAFTEQGASMLSAVLRSAVAVRASIAIMRAFVAMRRIATTAVELSEIRKELELLKYADESILESVNDLSEYTREEIETLYEAIGELSLKVLEPPKRPRRPIGYIQFFSLSL